MACEKSEVKAALKKQASPTTAVVGMRDGSKMTVAGPSALRVLEEESGAFRLHLLHGSLWVGPATTSAAKPLLIHEQGWRALRWTKWNAVTLSRRDTHSGRSIQPHRRWAWFVSLVMYC